MCRKTSSAALAFPYWREGRRPHCWFRGFVEHLLALRPAASRNRLAILSILGFDRFVSFSAAKIATGQATFPSGDFHPETHELSTAHRQPATKQGRANLQQNRAGRVERWRGGLGRAYLLPALSFAGASLAMPCSVSTSRSSNRTGRFPASGSRTRTIMRSPTSRHADNA
jgi:hypothetical protein